MGMIDDQTTGPWIKKKPAERKYFSYTKSKSSYPISIKKKPAFVFVLIMISFVQNIWD